jgi:hypothetical protein
VAALQKKLKDEKKLREQAESLSSNFHHSWLIATETIEKNKATFEEEKATLVKRAEEAESKLEPVTQELQTLKGHITKNVFGYFLVSSSSCKPAPIDGSLLDQTTDSITMPYRQKTEN